MVRFYIKKKKLKTHHTHTYTAQRKNSTQAHTLRNKKGRSVAQKRKHREFFFWVCVGIETILCVENTKKEGCYDDSRGDHAIAQYAEKIVRSTHMEETKKFSH